MDRSFSRSTPATSPTAPGSSLPSFELAAVQPLLEEKLPQNHAEGFPPE